jgi:hypothetical protein
MSAIVVINDYRKLKQYDVGVSSSDTYEGYPGSKFQQPIKKRKRIYCQTMYTAI